MCGILGVMMRDGAVDRGVVQRMSRTLQHRGPDADGIYINGRVGLGFRRLSILDLTCAADQPMQSDDGRLVLVFNGEIFNYIELRRELQALGHSFNSTGDTEVLLHAYAQWGRDCLRRLNGMWAFLVYNTNTGTLFGSRDRFGIKPLYRYRSNEAVFFASEIKAIRASGFYRNGVNWTTVSRFLRTARLDLIDVANETFYAGIEEVPPGSAFELHSNGSMDAWRYWSLDALTPTTVTDPPDAFRELFEDAIRLRMRSDVPVGVSLSGGLDSTSIISVMARAREAAGVRSGDGSLQAFCFMSEDFDETPFITDTLEQTRAELHRVGTQPRALWDKLDTFLWFHDEPVHSFAAMVGFEVYGLAAANGLKVVLSGQGSDEVLAGYPNYFDDYWQELLRARRLRDLEREIDAYAHTHGASKATLLRRSLRRYCLSQLGRARMYRALVDRRRQAIRAAHPWFTPDVSLADAPRAERSQPSLDVALRASVERAPLPLYLRIEDRNSMAHSVEARVPFLDYRIVSMLFQLEPQWKLNGPWNKYLLREAMRGCIPESVRTRADKMGFPVPGARWFRTDLYEPMQDLLASDDTRARGIYNIPAIRRDLERHRAGDVDVTDGLFAVAQLERWFALQHTAEPALPAAH